MTGTGFAMGWGIAMNASQVTPLALVALATLSSALGCTAPAPTDLDSNPFLAGGQEGKEDSGYINAGAVEVHLDLEADVTAADHRIFAAPAELTLYAMMNLLRQAELHVEILPEDTTPDLVEWRVDGEWLNRAQAEALDPSQLRHFRISGVEAIVYRNLDVAVGDVYRPVVPMNPYTVLADGGTDCSRDKDRGFLSGYYWWEWRPELPDCDLPTQEMTLTVTEVLPQNPPSYPEYDQLWADDQLDVVVVFGRVDHGPIETDSAWRSITKMVRWLEEGGFTETDDAPLGRRFTKASPDGALTSVVDVYGPDLYEHVADDRNFHNWQRAVSEHEVILYNGHSELGGGSAFTRVDYPDFYQVFHLSNCLGYEYYRDPIIEGKGGFAAVDVVSNIQPTNAQMGLTVTNTILAELVRGFENGGTVSWQDILGAVVGRITNFRFGVSAARGNCFSPDGDLCGDAPAPSTEELRFESTGPMSIEDAGEITSTLEAREPDTRVGRLTLEFDIRHTFMADLEITLEHDGIRETILEPGNPPSGNLVTDGDRLHGSIDVSRFYGMAALGDWTLRVADHFAGDEGTLERWAVVVTPR